MHLEFTKTAQGRRWAAKVALVAMGCSAALGVGIAAPIGAQDPAAPATGAPASTSATEQTVAPGQRDAVTNEPAPVKDTAKSDERLLNLIIIGLLVLAAVIALATLLFWKSTAPEEQEEPEAADGERPVSPGQDPPVEPGIDLGLLEAPLPVESSPAPAGEAPAPAPLRRVMASFPRPRWATWLTCRHPNPSTNVPRLRWHPAIRPTVTSARWEQGHHLAALLWRLPTPFGRPPNVPGRIAYRRPTSCRLSRTAPSQTLRPVRRCNGPNPRHQRSLGGFHHLTSQWATRRS